MPLHPTALIGSSAATDNSSTSLRNPCHHTRVASCSTQPGCGRETSCSTTDWATSVPSARTSTPLALDVPMSIPSSMVVVLVVGGVVGGLIPGCHAPPASDWNLL